VFAAPALGRLIRGWVRPLISLVHPVPNQVPCLVCTVPSQLVPTAWVLSMGRTQQLLIVEARSGCLVDRSQQKVSNRPARDATGAPYAETHEHVTVLVDTGHQALRAFGTKRPWVRIPPPRHHQTAGQEPMPSDSCSVSAPDRPVQLRSTAARLSHRARLQPCERLPGRRGGRRPRTRPWSPSTYPAQASREPPQFRRALARYLLGRTSVLAFSNRGVDNCNTPA